MENKNEILRQIADMICENGVTLAEVATFVSYVPRLQQFDVAVITYEGMKLRVPFFKRDKMKVIGIYPFKTSNYYLELNEYNKLTRSQANERAKDNQAIPPVGFWQEVATILSPLNEALHKLGASPVTGHYYATKSGDTFDNRLNVIADFSKDDFEICQLSPEAWAWTRYVGIIE